MTKKYTKEFDTVEQPLESGRYRLLRAEVCPYAHRTAIARRLLGLNDVISEGTVSSVKSPDGWVFSLDKDGVDPVLQVASVPDIYRKSDPTHKTGGAVPVLVDEKTGLIVRTESLDILRDLILEFKEFHGEDAPDLYPEELRVIIDLWNQRIDAQVVSAFYRIGFSKTQKQYDLASEKLFDTLNQIEEHLEGKVYFHGDQITETDILLFTPLIRWDSAYEYLFNVNAKRITDYPNLYAYVKRLYHIDAFHGTTHFEAIREGYFTDPKFSDEGIIPAGPDLSHWEEA